MELRDAGRICLALLGLVCFWGPVTSVHAETAQEFIAKAPQGIALTNAFVTGESVTDSQQQNSAKVITAKGSASQTQAVLVTSAPQQVGTIWSQPGNEFDLTHDVTTSMWMYFGDKREKAADGMALVIHNDPRGLKAMPQFTDKIFGETLGVWGVDNQNTRTDPQAIAATAIQNSWALEFDTFLNKTADYAGAGLGTSFDTKLKGPHIASNYPGDAASYQVNRVTPGILAWDKTPRYYFNLNHVQPIQGDKNLLANGQWHHITLDWQSHTQTMTYTFDDKDPQTGEPLPGKQQAVKLDLQKIDPEKTGKATWGFTGSNGMEAANNLVIFEGVPGLVNASAKATLTDLTTHQPVTAGGQVRGDTPVELTYRVNYHDGKQDWAGVQLDVALPQRIQFTQGEVTYANQRRQTLTAAQLKDGHLVATLDQNLNMRNHQATIRLTGVTQNDVRPQPIAATRASFSAVNGIATTAVPKLTLVPNYQLDLARESPAKTTVKYGDAPTIRGQVTWPSSVQLTNRELRLQATVNGRKQADQPLDEPVAGAVRYTPAAKLLKGGHNDVQLKVRDNYGNTSPTIKVDVNVVGTLSLDLVHSEAFQTTQLTGQAPASVGRAGDWRVLVRDTRAAGAKWQLQIAATPFRRTADDHPLDGQLMYVDGQHRTAITADPIPIHRGTAMDDQPVFDVAATWNQQRGLSLHLGTQALAGEYQANLHWSLNDAPH
ncbi:cell surface protein [Levilactobacillus zymae]|uniref:Cell surface protein n=1 Tax=Levilactobacillus zymae TaxID=267363 RepID=A0ABQ0X0S9_9LACO|nr:L-type lectin-domain containing protein [Levilactobacillus zymae]KRL13542.1 hypothetical protein FD38_GL001191 [Levilactobacillus zymae DSM 19395]QFR61080.1 hypothetical protein LZ395_05935 [Levilactobacillus zymae]GEO72057.1 cell surface protein [Levilactobacillus zymae]